MQLTLVIIRRAQISSRGAVDGTSPARPRQIDDRE
jgi:hypothetical protein